MEQLNTPRTRILFATGNKHKSEEVAAMLGDRVDLIDLSVFGSIELPDETGETFLENATIKACYASEFFEGYTISDDSGLVVDALNGEPGIRSARFAGEGATDAMNRALLMQRLRDSNIPPEQWTARFVCVVVLAMDGKVVRHFEGSVEGHIIPAEQGEGGFGYDPLFVPQGQNQTFGELPAEYKNRVSHRAKAIEGLRGFLVA